MTTRPMTFTVIAAAAGLLGAAPAFAQATPPTPPTAPAPPATPALATPTPATPIPPARGNAMVERRISELHSELKITPSEQQSFDAFADVMRENANRMNAITQDRRKTLATMSAVDQMKGYQEVAQAHAEDMQRLVPAFARLYETLTPEQKKQADSSFRDFAQSARSSRARS